MERTVVFLLFIVIVNQHVFCEYVFRSLLYENRTDPATRQLYEFRKDHPKPIGLLTISSGEPVDVRKTITLNTDIFDNTYFVDSLLHLDSEVIPERVVHAKGTAAWGYFEVTNDVSKYTKADVFNGIGKKTPIVGRFSSVAQNKGGNDLAREAKGLAIKFYTREGNLDYLCLNFPVFSLKDPEYFKSFAHILKRNPQTNLVDNTARIDFFSLRPETLHNVLWLLSDYGIPNGYRKMDAFAIHTYEINNRNGERYFVKFNFRTQQGIENLPSDEAIRISGMDPDYYNRDLYNAIEKNDYPVWKFEMDVLNFTDILNLNYNPFDVTVLWKKGTYHTVEIGRIIFNRNPDNMYRVSELSAFNPANLVPGIPGPIDELFKSRRLSYGDTQKHRLGANYNRIEVNHPTYVKVYNRDGEPPVEDNMKNAPNYYPNSFSGPIPYVDASKPKNKLSLLESQTADFQEAAYFYNHVLDNDDQRTRLANNTVQLLLQNPPFLQQRWINLYYMIDYHLGDETASLLYRALKYTNTTIVPRKILRVPRDKCY
ncbi:PREDICTED: catalase-like [Papilio xuthus]|uniref:Catalase-like n=1 Tax=Papilio xuthus TaxID=66420 RepID=A0AAJ6ZIM3_PAPXU|nr:PREDICTED: catalase-like [Papilio xuthus]